MFLRDVWYVAAWSSEVKPDAMMARRILGDGVVFFRDASGRAVALRDRCPHRFAPLHLGRLTDGVIECGYHGLQFNGQGGCIFNPHGDGQIPPNAKVQSYPLEERHEALWIWMGDVARADPSLIPDFSMVMDDRTTIVRGYLNPLSNYELMTDNLLDLGHTAYLHADSLGSEAIVHSTRTTRRDGDKVVYELWAPDGDAPMATQIMMPWFQGKQVDHWMVSTWSPPGVIHQLTGTAIAGKNKQDATVTNGLHWLTPETDTSTHYFQALSRSFRRDDAELDAMIQMAVQHAFVGQDFPMVGAIQGELNASDPSELRPVVLSTDAGGIMARRIMQQKIQEQGLKASPQRAAQ